jgi:hypothetical protein
MRECIQNRVDIHFLQSMETMAMMMSNMVTIMAIVAFEPLVMVMLMMAKSLFESTPTRCGHKGYKSHKKYK